MTGVPLQVTAYLDTLCAGLPERELMLDGTLAWAAAVTAAHELPPITSAHAPDILLPLATWQAHGTWGWCTSAARLDIVSWTATEIRRKPAAAAMARYTRDARHHTGLGPYKARQTVVPLAWVRTAVWQVLATDTSRVVELLGSVTHLGRHTAHGYGRVSRWQVDRSDMPEGWRDRPMPTPGAPAQAYRAPYWHPTRRFQVPE